MNAHAENEDSAMESTTIVPSLLEGEVLRAVDVKGMRRKYALNTLDGLRKEMSAIYRRSRDGAIDAKLGSALIWQLSQIGRVLELVEIERRIARLEDLSGK